MEQAIKIRSANSVKKTIAARLTAMPVDFAYDGALITAALLVLALLLNS